MSAAADHLSTEKGHVTNLQIARFNQLAEGGVGLIISGAIIAHSSGKTYAGSPTLADDDAIAGYKKLVSEVHKRGDTHRATCVSCNKCGLALGEGKPLDCYLEG